MSSQLRSFKSYGNVAPYVPFAFACSLTNIDGYAAGAGWLQIHDTATALAGGEVPLKSWNVAGAGPLPSVYYPIGPVTLLNGLTIALSSTEATYTAVATSFDIFGEIEEFEFDNTVGTSIAGDTTTPRNTLVVFTDGQAPPKSIYRIQVTERLGADRYLFIRVGQSPNLIYLPLGKVAANTTVIYNFGVAGLSPFKVDSDLSLHNGCTLDLANGQVPPLAFTGGSGFIKAWYKTPQP